MGAIIGQALVLGRPALLPYAAVVAAAAAAVVSFVRWYEEPTLSHRFGDDYNTYRRTVPRWWPRHPRRPT